MGELEGCVHYKVGTLSAYKHSKNSIPTRFSLYLKLNFQKNQFIIFFLSNVFFKSLPAVKYERIKFLVIALKNSVEIYAWAPKPYHKFMAFKVITEALVCICDVKTQKYLVKFRSLAAEINQE